MALDLFVNFERQSNNSLFYREVSAIPLTVFIKLSDQSIENFTQAATANFIAQYGINNSIKVDYNFTNTISASFVRTTPCVSSVQVSVSSLDGTFLQDYELSAVFLPEFPTADFIAYPNSYFDEISCTLNYLSASNYQESPGVYFYGEGHTETIHLSSTSLASGVSSVWIIGKDFNTTSYLVSSIDNVTARVVLSSYVSQNEILPISLKLSNSYIKQNGPAIKYDDETGQSVFYPFFISTVDTSGTNLSSNTNLKDSIAIKPYPQVAQYNYNSPFLNNRFNLPYDYSNQIFEASVEKASLSSILTERLNTTTWELDTTSKAGDWTWSKTLQEIFIYYFPLGYDTSLTNIPNFLKCSPTETTTVTQNVTATKFVKINFPPYDWLENTQTETFSAQTTVIPIPYITLYIPNYLNLRNEDVVIHSIKTYASSDFVLKQVTISSEDGTPVSLSGNELTSPFTISFEKIGVKSLSAYCVFYNQSLEQNQTIVNVFPKMVQIVDQYDEIDLESYHSFSTPLTLSLTSAPLITPNEWVVENNINSVIEKIYLTVEEIDNYTTVYTDKSKLYGWLGNDKYVWSDLECPPNSAVEVAWKQHEVCTEPEATAGYPIYWLEHECEKQIGDPSCLQKYCLNWKWKNRRRATSDILTTWADSKCQGQYAKKWKYESCEVDNEVLNCDKGKWHISTIDADFFPIPFCIEKPRCKIKGLIQLPDDTVVIAHDTELNLLDDSYQSTLIARQGIADEIYAFANIQAIDQTKNGKICVLDSVIPRVCIYNVKNSAFEYFSSWGGFGLKSSLYGFNNPKDLHVSFNDEILITDSGNKCIKRYTSVGKHIQTIDTELFSELEPLSVCQDSKGHLHILFENKVTIISLNEVVVKEYALDSEIVSPVRINSSYNGELIYIAHATGIAKYFNTGVFFGYLLLNYECSDGAILKNFYSVHQDEHRNLLISVEDKILKIVDYMKLSTTRAPFLSGLYWQKQDVLIHKEEYVQPWVYLKSFHRLWDNIELLRNSLFYEASGCKTYTAPLYTKEELVIGQNEIVTNATINRLSNQLWNNIQTLTKYFDINCKN